MLPVMPQLCYYAPLSVWASPNLQSHQRNSDSSLRLSLVLRFSLNTLGLKQRSFSPLSVWSSCLEFSHSLPVHVTRQSRYLVTFEKHLKTYLLSRNTSVVEPEEGGGAGRGGGGRTERLRGGTERERDGKGGGGEEEKGHTTNELYIIVLLLVLNLLCFTIFYFIQREEKGCTSNELCVIVLLLVLNLLCFIIFYFI